MEYDSNEAKTKYKKGCVLLWLYKAVHTFTLSAQPASIPIKKAGRTSVASNSSVMKPGFKCCAGLSLR